VTNAAERYDRWHEAHDAEEQRPTATAPWHELAKRQLGNVSGLHVLEIACGRGAFAEYLLDQGAVVTAADVSKSAIASTRHRLAGRQSWDALVADLQQLPFEDARFDLVVSLETLEHLPDPAEGLAELIRVTRPGGYLIVTIPNYFSLRGLGRLVYRLTGREWKEEDQPINQPLTVFWLLRHLRRARCQIETVDGRVHILAVPFWRTVRFGFLEHPHFLTKWFAAHTLVRAVRP
jgi:ubiquinone/menaquinone biosynthesis C-methylase UbiE